MDYEEWGKDYQAEADRLKARLSVLRSAAKTSTAGKSDSAIQRLNLLEDMYMDCVYTARLLAQRGIGA